MAFRFAIGDLVLTRTGIADCYLSARMGAVQIPNHFVVLEHLTVTCNGGTQEWYAIVREGEARRLRIDEVTHPDEFSVSNALKLYDDYFLLHPKPLQPYDDA